VKVGLTHKLDTAAGDISHGDKRKLEIAVLLATEVASCCSTSRWRGRLRRRRGLVDNIREMQELTGCTVLMVEHHIDVLMGSSRRSPSCTRVDHRVRLTRTDHGEPRRAERLPRPRPGAGGSRPHERTDPQVTHLSASIAGQQVVEDVSFEVPATGITAVLGRNGVGKTSTMRGILGLISRRAR
jgi:ABC-type branched-subunit amino acid transport system ATPase component